MSRIKGFLLIVLLSLQFFNASAADVIVMKNGDLINAVVTEITPVEIKYKKAGRPDGPTYTINKSDVLAINYEDGEKETFSDSAPSASDNQSTPSVTESSYDTEINRCSIEEQNRYYPVYSKDDTNKNADHVLIIFNATPEAVLADENVEISVETGLRVEDVSSDYKTIRGYADFSRVATGDNMRFKITNKTGDILYVDLQNSFMLRAGLGQSYYVPKATTTGHSSGSSIGFNLGALSPLLSGISVGSSSATGQSTTIYSQRVLQIPPHSFIYLEGNGIFVDFNSCGSYDDIAVQTNGFVDRMKDDGWALKQKFYIAANFDKEDALKRGQVISFEPEDTQTRIGQILTYSGDPEFNTAHVIKTEFYVRYMVGFATGQNSYKALQRDKFNQSFPDVERAFTTQVPIVTQENSPVVKVE